MTRKQLVSGLRSLHEDVTIETIKLNKRNGAITIDYGRHVDELASSPKTYGQLIIADPNFQPPTKKPKG